MNITPASFAHPAKMSRGLLERIIAHGFENGYWQEGSLIGDCFGGIGTTGIIGAYNGLCVVSVELEKKFVSLARRNYALHASKWKALGSPRPVVIQGDSRAFHVLVGRRDAVIASPPFTQGYQSGGGINKNGYGADGKDKVGSRTYQGTGGDRTAGNIETLKEGSVQGVISSPPYAESVHDGNGIDASKLTGNPAGPNSQAGNEGYGSAPGQIGALKSGSVDGVVSSPPYISGGHHPDQTGAWNTNGRGTNAGGSGMGSKEAANYGKTEGQIGQLQPGDVHAVVTSPPWEDEAAGGCPGSRLKVPPSSGKGHAASLGARERQAQRDEERTYGTSVGQIGTTSGETYWQAMDAVYRSCFQAIKPGGVLVLVLKDYVKGGKRVPLCDDTVRLIEHIGFTVDDRIHAMLVKSTNHADLFGADTVQTKSRKSFFRRLAEKKGSPAIDYEEVLIARRP